MSMMPASTVRLRHFVRRLPEPRHLVAGHSCLFGGVPLAHGAQREHDDYGNSRCAGDSTDQQADPVCRRAVAGALEVDERVADEPAAHPADDDGGQRECPRES